MGSRIRYEDVNDSRDYTDNPTHIRVYRDDHGDEPPWCVDAVDERGNYSDALYRYSTHGEAITVGVAELVAHLCYNGPAITRENQSADVIYVGPRADVIYVGLTCFVSPDGIGRYYYDGINEAQRQHGTLPVVFASSIED